MRHQLPVYSPLSATALLKGAASAVLDRSDAGADLRKSLRDRYGFRSLILTDSGTSALRLALEAAAARREGPIALPAYSCFDLATAVVGSGVRPVFYDLVPGTLSPDYSSLARAVEQGVSAVVIAHLYGIPVELKDVHELCSATGAILIEDAAQAFGAEYRGRPLGAHGSLGIVSFGRGKGVTGGGGGGLLSNDEAGEEALSSLAERRRAPSAGWSALFKSTAQWLLGRPSLYALPLRFPGLRLGETVYRTPWPPGDLSAMSAGMLSVTLGLSEREVDRRRGHARRLLSSLDQSGWLEPVEAPQDADPSYLRLPVLPTAGRDGRAHVAEAERLGIMPGYPEPLHRLPALREHLADEAREFEGAERLASSLFTLPTHGLLTERDLSALEAWMRREDGWRARAAAAP